MSNRVGKFWHEQKAFIIFIFLMCVFRSAVADWNTVPSGSMLPTIEIGDRILVNKLAYDIRVPFAAISLFKLGDPVRGDIIVFDSAASGKRLVKRVVGVPGDEVELKDNVLFINGVQAKYTLVNAAEGVLDQTEELLNVEHDVRQQVTGSALSNFSPITVPPDSYLAMGDNRDHSADSRVIGFVPRGEIVGRTRSVVMSLDYDNYYLPRADRFFHPL